MCINVLSAHMSLDDMCVKYPEGSLEGIFFFFQLELQIAVSDTVGTRN